MKLDTVIAKRPDKTIYRDGDKTVKVFNESYSKANVLNEALNQSRVEETSLKIPKLYEVAKVEGTTRWEEFWFITLPMMMRTMMLVIILSIVELVSSNTNLIVSGAYLRFNSMEYGVGSAMLWFYFLIVGVFISVLYIIYNRVFLKRWG